MFATHPETTCPCTGPMFVLIPFGAQCMFFGLVPHNTRYKIDIGSNWKVLEWTPLGINTESSRMKKIIVAPRLRKHCRILKVCIIAYDDVWCRFCAGICDP